MRTLVLVLLGLMFFGTVHAQTAVMSSSAYGNDTTISTTPRSVTDTATTKDWLLYGFGKADFLIKIATYFNGSWSDSVTVDSVDQSVSGSYIKRVTGITTDSLKNMWLPDNSSNPYTHTLLKAKNGWLYQMILVFPDSSMSGVLNGGIISVDEMR